MTRWLALLYGIGCYAVTGVVTLYTACFVASIWVPLSVGRGDNTVQAFLFDMTLIAVFGLQHSLMARVRFKRWWTRVVPVMIERSTYVLASNVALVLLLILWQPLPGVVWSVANDLSRIVLFGLAMVGVVVMAWATFQMNHAELLGLRQVWAYFRGLPLEDLPFQIPPLYRVSRHPMMLGLLVALWSTPDMTLGRFVFCTGMSAYILIGIQLEERDLRRRFGKPYEDYRQRVLMLLGKRR